MNAVRLLLILVALAWLLVQGGVSASEPTTAEVSARHAASLSAIVTLSCRVEIRGEKPRLVLGAPGRTAPPLHQTAQYRKSAERIRLDEFEGVFGQRSVFYDMKKGEAVQCPTDTSRSYHIVDVNHVQTVIDVWREAVCLPDGPLNYNRVHATLDHALSDPRCEVRTIKWTTLEERQLLYLDFRLGSGDNRTEVWVDPTANYLMRKVVHHQPRPDRVRIECEVLSFVEPTRGVHFPERVRRTIWSGSATTGATILTVSDLRVNEVIDEAALTPRLPSGVRVIDEIRGKTFTVDPGGRLNPLGVINAGGDASLISPDEGRSYSGQTPLDSEETQWWRWAAIGFAGMAIFCGWLALRRRRRRAVG